MVMTAPALRNTHPLSLPLVPTVMPSCHQSTLKCNATRACVLSTPPCPTVTPGLHSPASSLHYALSLLPATWSPWYW